MIDGLCAVHPSYQLVSSLPHQLTSHLVNIAGAVTATIMRFWQNFRNLDNVKCEPTSGEQKVGGGGGYRKGEMNEHVSDSKQMTCSGINKFRKGYQFTTLLAWGFCRLPQPEYVEFKTLTVSKSIHPSPIILRVQMLLKTGIDT